MKTKNVFGRLLLAVIMCASLTLTVRAQVTIGSLEIPQATLDIIGDTAKVYGGAFRLIDGNQAEGKVLTVVGDNGVATWRYPALTRIVGVNNSVWQTALRFPLAIEAGRVSGNGTFKQTGANITLPPGKWEVNVRTLISIVDVSTNPPHQHDLTADDFAWVRSTFTDSPTAEGTNIISPDIVTTINGSLISGRVSGPKPSAQLSNRNTWGMISGAIIIENTSGEYKTYYYVAGGIDTNSSFTEDQVVVVIRTDGLESSIVATPMLY